MSTSHKKVGNRRDLSSARKYSSILNVLGQCCQKRQWMNWAKGTAPELFLIKSTPHLPVALAVINAEVDFILLQMSVSLIYSINKI